jgi:hypothetical protein
MIVCDSFVIADWTDQGVTSRGTPHSYWNATPGPTHYLLVMTPRIHALIEALHSGERDDYARIFAEHDSELLS